MQFDDCATFSLLDGRCAHQSKHLYPLELRLGIKSTEWNPPDSIPMFGFQTAFFFDSYASVLRHDYSIFQNKFFRTLFKKKLTIDRAFVSSSLMSGDSAE